MIKYVIACLIGGLSLSACATGAGMSQSECLAHKQPAPPSPETYRVLAASISVPVGYVLIARDGDVEVALILSGVWRGDVDGGCATYRGYWRHRGETSFRVTEGSVAALTPYGIHPFVSLKGDQAIRIGPTKLGYHYPSLVGLRQPKGVRVAPTPWVDLKDVDFENPQLHWFALSEDLDRSVFIEAPKALARE